MFLSGRSFMSMTQLPELMTVAEVAEAFRTTDETIHRWARDGKLPYIPLPSGTKRFRRIEIEAILTPAAEANAA